MRTNKFWGIWGVILLLSVFLTSGCDTYQKLLKSSDYDLKLVKVKEFYNTGEFDKALPLFEELMGIYRGTKDAEKLYYYYAYCHYGMEDYLSASHYFKTFISAYPRSIYTEDAQFMIGYSFYKMSPKTSLEQGNTQKAVDAQNKQATVNEKIGAVFASMGGGEGTQAISASGNLLAGIKAAFSPNKHIAAFQPVSGANAVAKQNADAAGGGGMNPMFLLLGAGLLILLIFKKR